MERRDGQFPKSPTITKRAFQGRSKKRLILKVTTKVFAGKGFNQPTILQIASKANIAEGSIYDYFKSKKDLLFVNAEERMKNFLSDLHRKVLK